MAENERPSGAECSGSNFKLFMLVRVSVPKCSLVVSFQDSLVDRPNRFLSKMSNEFSITLPTTFHWCEPSWKKD